MLRIFICLASMYIACSSIAQSDLTTVMQQDIPEMRADKNFKHKYDQKLRLLRRTFPMALKAKELIDEYEADLAAIEKRRKQKKYGREAHKDLKEEFLYNIKDLYVTEGDMLMKVIHRETGMTVHQIIERYRGDFSSDVYEGIAKIWGNDLDQVFDPKNPGNDDWITEIVIQDILAGRVDFDLSMRKMSKEDYKISMEEYREKLKESRKRTRNLKRDRKKKEKAGQEK